MAIVAVFENDGHYWEAGVSYENLGVGVRKQGCNIFYLKTNAYFSPNAIHIYQ